MTHLEHLPMKLHNTSYRYDMNQSNCTKQTYNRGEVKQTENILNPIL